MLKAVIFDMDGVVVDSQPYHFKADSIIFNKLDLDIPTEERDTFVGKASRKMWSFIKNKYQLDQPVEQLMQLDKTIRIKHISAIEDVAPMPGAVDLLNDLAQNNVRIALASSSPIEVINILIDKVILRKYFHVIVSGEFIENGKPDPDIFIYTAKLLGEDVADCIVIEDSENGVRAAKSAGTKCIGLKNNNSGNQDLSLSDKIINDLHEINYHVLNLIMKKSAYNHVP
jgi:HAD superfamily hydrolase (TIGR01509 family)